MKNVYLIRHGLPDFPGGSRMCLGTTDIPMAAEGISQARRMAKALPPVTAVFSSPLTRALQTAEAIGLPVTVLEGLREAYAGQWDGLTFDEIRRRYPALYAAREKDLTIPPPDAEDKEESLVRFLTAMKIAGETAPGDFAVVAHGGVIAVFLEHITGTRYKPDYTEIIPLCYENGNFILKEES